MIETKVVEKFEVGKTYNSFGDRFTVVKRTPKMLVLDCEYSDGGSETKRAKIHHISTETYGELAEHIKPYGQYGCSVFPNEIED